MAEQKFTPRAENVLRLAQETALELGHGYVGCEHILLGLLREDGGAACRALGEAGVTEEQLREQLVRTVGHGLSGSLPSQGLTPRARSAVEMAVAEAMRFASPRIGTEHLRRRGPTRSAFTPRWYGGSTKRRARRQRRETGCCVKTRAASAGADSRSLPAT